MNCLSKCNHFIQLNESMVSFWNSHRNRSIRFSSHLQGPLFFQNIFSTSHDQYSILLLLNIFFQWILRLLTKHFILMHSMVLNMFSNIFFFFFDSRNKFGLCFLIKVTLDEPKKKRSVFSFWNSAQNSYTIHSSYRATHKYIQCFWLKCCVEIKCAV